MQKQSLFCLLLLLLMLLFDSILLFIMNTVVLFVCQIKKRWDKLNWNLFAKYFEPLTIIWFDDSFVLGSILYTPFVVHHFIIDNYKFIHTLNEEHYSFFFYDHLTNSLNLIFFSRFIFTWFSSFYIWFYPLFLSFISFFC